MEFKLFSIEICFSVSMFHKYYFQKTYLTFHFMFCLRHFSVWFIPWFKQVKLVVVAILMLMFILFFNFNFEFSLFYLLNASISFIYFHLDHLNRRLWCSHTKAATQSIRLVRFNGIEVHPHHRHHHHHHHHYHHHQYLVPF